MADPRFYDNRGPFTLAEICAKAGIAVPGGVHGAAHIFDLASLDGAGPQHLSFFTGVENNFTRSRAGACFVPAQGAHVPAAPSGMLVIPCASVHLAFAQAASLFYPDALAAWAPAQARDPSARLGQDVVLGPGVVIGARAEIGDRSHIGANSVIGPGVAIGRDCQIGGVVTISHAFLGDRVIVQAGARIGGSMIALASSDQDFVMIPQLGRVIIQDGVEIGPDVSILRGSLDDTVIGEGSQIEDLVQVSSDQHIDRHSVLASPDYARADGRDHSGFSTKPIRRSLGGVFEQGKGLREQDDNG